MSATMAREGGRVQLEQSDMHLALNMAKMAKGGISRAAIEETQQLIKKPLTEVREEKKRGVGFPGHTKVMAAIERHLARVHLHQDGRHRGPNRHLCQLMTMRGPKQKVCHPQMCIYNLCFSTLDFYQ